MSKVVDEGIKRRPPPWLCEWAAVPVMQRRLFSTNRRDHPQVAPTPRLCNNPPTMAPATLPEQRARETIDAALEAAGWAVQDRDAMNLYAAPGVAVREFALASGHGFADYLLFVDGKAVGVLEAKPEGHTLTGVEPQSRRTPRACRPA